ncbi:SRPBCC family protein [Pontibacter sp. JAM-7]|uniref:SRPBCC family protein n=1 Tax=Pontibacter sp. JAM-7 TaxID=3366581 RepID=UPI003AF48664
MHSLRNALLLSALISGQALAAGNIAVTESVQLNAKPAAVWALVGDFNGLYRWHPAVIKSQSTSDTGRILTLGNGATISETLLSQDNEAHSYSYRIDESPLPVASYEASIAVSATENGSLVTWSSSFDASGASDEEAASTIRGVYKAGLEHLSDLYN